MAEQDIKKFIRHELLHFYAYTAAVSPGALLNIQKGEIVKLDQNENLYGCSPRVSQALAEYTAYNIYPDAEQTGIRQQLAEYTGASPENIVASSGSNQLLDIITRLFVGEGDGAVNFVPTFDIYRFSTEICGGRVIEIQRDNKFAVGTDALHNAIDERTKLIFLANPNAPTGNITPERDIIEILESGIPTVVDEAYYEFSGITVLPLMKQYKNLMVVRTFSKWAGLAGLRVGYGIFPVEIAEYLHRIKIPYNVNVAALVAVQESLNDLKYLKGINKKISEERERLFEGLSGISWLKPFPSRANFILCEVKGHSAEEVHLKLQEQGILIRYFKKPRLENCIRVSVGKPEHTDRLLSALRELYD